MVMAEHDDLDDILDSALDDFRNADSGCALVLRPSKSSSIETCETVPLGQGLAIGLPVLGPKGEKAGHVKAKSFGKVLPNATAGRESTTTRGHLTDTVEELAKQTRQTLKEMDIHCQEEMADKLVESIIKQFEDLGSSQDLQSIMDRMMQQLLSKEVLHEPMRELCANYPRFLAANKPMLSNDDFNGYSREYQCIKELCAVYDTTPDDFGKIADIMQNMQARGQLPAEDLIQELELGMDLGCAEGWPFISDQESTQEAQDCGVM